MPTVTLIRHGQAGARDHYDVLSETGIEQARLLGAWFASRGAIFDTVLSGTLQRQFETARTTFSDGSGTTITSDASWNEFDLDAVFSTVAPRLAAADKGFAGRWADVQREVAAGGDGIHRRWTPADGEVMWAWINNRFGELDGVESWTAFRARIRRALYGLRTIAAQARIAVCTSALPAAVCVGETLGLDENALLSLAGTSYNTGVTTIALDATAAALLSFNVASHLPDRLLTFR